MDGWMIWDFTSFLAVFQSYQENVWMMMKGCVQWNSVYGWEDFTSSEDRTRSARSVGQRLTYWATGAPYLIWRWMDTLSGALTLLFSFLQHTCHTSHCEIKSHRIQPIWKPIPWRIFKSHRISWYIYKRFYEKVNINHILLCQLEAY